MSAPTWWASFWNRNLGGSINRAGVANRVFLTPVELPHSAVASRVSLQITVAGGGGTNMRIGLYADNGRTPAGGALLADSGNMDATITGARSYTFPTALNLDKGFVWIALETADTTVNFSGNTIAEAFADVGSEMLLGCRYDLGGFGALTDPCPAVTYVNIAKINAYLRIDSWGR